MKGIYDRRLLDRPVYLMSRELILRVCGCLSISLYIISLLKTCGLNCLFVTDLLWHFLFIHSVEIDGSFGESDSLKESGSKKRYKAFLVCEIDWSEFWPSFVTFEFHYCTLLIDYSAKQ